MKKKRILLIEDDEPTRESAVFKLNKAGFETDFAEDGHHGLEKLRQDGAFDLILLDIRIPKGDGFAFLEEKIKDPKLKGIPVIVFTNLSQRNFVERALELGAIGYLVKAHHSLDEVVEEVERGLKEGKCEIDY